CKGHDARVNARYDTDVPARSASRRPSLRPTSAAISAVSEQTGIGWPRIAQTRTSPTSATGAAATIPGRGTGAFVRDRPGTRGQGLATDTHPWKAISDAMITVEISRPVGTVTWPS